MRFQPPLVLLLIVCASHLMHSQQLESYRWKNRILILCDSALSSKALESQLGLLDKEKVALAERDLKVLLLVQEMVINFDGTIANLDFETLRNELGVSDTFRGAVLVGKDGDLKLKETFPVATEKIFTLIDGMPMRRAEMRQNARKN